MDYKIIDKSHFNLRSCYFFSEYFTDPKNQNKKDSLIQTTTFLLLLTDSYITVDFILKSNIKVP